MSFELKGAYSILLDLIYMQGGELPDDPRYISGLLGMSVRKWNSIRKDLLAMGKIHINGTSISNYRAIIELESLRKLQEKQRENRSGPNKNNDLEKPRFDHTEPEPDTELLPVGNNPPNPQTDLLGEPLASPPATVGKSSQNFDDEFEKVWERYPRKVGKGAARKAWAKARKTTDRTVMGNSLMAHIRVWAGGTPKDKIPHLSTWLNQERWNDDPSASANRSQNSDEQMDSLMAPQEDALGNDFLNSFNPSKKQIDGVLAGSVKRIGK